MFSLILNAIAADQFEGWSYYIGDPHAHTGISGDGFFYDAERCPSCGTLANVFERAKNNNLDWVAITDHINSSAISQSNHFAAISQEILANDQPGTFVTIPGAEVSLITGLDKIGHRTILLFADDAQLYGLEMSQLQFNGSSTQIETCDNVYTWATDLEARLGPVLLMPHHPATAKPTGVDWNCHFPEYEPMVEVYSKHGNSMYADLSWDPPNWGGFPEGAIDQALNPDTFSLQFGFAAGTDSHDTNPGSICAPDQASHYVTAGGLTVAVLPGNESFNRQNLYTAFVEHRSYATTGPMIPLQIYYSSLDNPLGTLGQTLPLPEGQPLTVQLNLPPEYQPWITALSLRSPEQRVEMLNNGNGQWTYTYDGDRVPVYIYAELEISGDIWNNVPCDDGGSDNTERIWLSPSWVQNVDGDVDGDGHSWAEGDCAEGDPNRGLGLPEIPDDGIDQDCNGRDLHAQDSASAPPTPDEQGCHSNREHASVLFLMLSLSTSFALGRKPYQ